MSAQLGQQAAERFGRIMPKWVNLYTWLQNASDPANVQIDMEAPLTTSGRTLAGLNRLIARLGAELPTLIASADLDLVPESYLVNLNAALEKMDAQLTSSQQDILKIDAGGGIGAISKEHWSVTSRNGSAGLNIVKHLGGTLYSYADTALREYLAIQMIVRPSPEAISSHAFARAADILERARRESQSIINTAQDAYRKTTDTLGSVNAILQKLQQRGNEAERIATLIDNDRKTLQEQTAESSKLISTVREVYESSEKLRDSIINSKVMLDNFYDSAREREEQFAASQDAELKLLSSMSDTERKIKEQIQQATDMLSGATIAGLAGEFGRIRKELDGQLTWARYGFYLSMVLLGIAVVPLIFLVVPTLDPILSMDGRIPIEEFVAHAIVRLVLLIPAAWFARFTANRHASLFRLREHYAYKYSIAASVDGFRRQATEYKDQIAAASFFELTFNPADRMDLKVQEERSPNPVLNWIMSRMGTTPDGKPE